MSENNVTNKENVITTGEKTTSPVLVTSIRKPLRRTNIRKELWLSLFVVLVISIIALCTYISKLSLQKRYDILEHEIIVLKEASEDNEAKLLLMKENFSKLDSAYSKHLADLELKAYMYSDVFKNPLVRITKYEEENESLIFSYKLYSQDINDGKSFLVKIRNQNGSEILSKRIYPRTGCENVFHIRKHTIKGRHFIEFWDGDTIIGGEAFETK